MNFKLNSGKFIEWEAAKIRNYVTVGDIADGDAADYH